MPETTRMLLLTDADGKIIGAAPKGPAGPGGSGIAIASLPGQSLFEVDVPRELAELIGTPDAHLVFSRFVVEPREAVLRPVPTRTRHAHDD
jgi:hypothetical protein